jgi:hypothetical protein
MTLNLISSKNFIEGHIPLDTILNAIDISSDDECLEFLGTSVDFYVTFKDTDTRRENNGFIDNLASAIQAIFCSISDEHKRLVIDTILSSKDKDLVEEFKKFYHKHVPLSYFIDSLYHFAAAAPDFFLFLVHECKELDIHIPDGKTLAIASSLAKRNKTETLKKAIALDIRYGKSPQAFRYACINNNIEIIKLFISCGIGFDSLFCEDWTYLLTYDFAEILETFPDASSYITKESAIKAVKVMNRDKTISGQDFKTGRVLKVIVNKLPELLEVFVKEAICKNLKFPELLHMEFKDQVSHLLVLPNLYTQYLFYSFLKNSSKKTHEDMIIYCNSLKMFTLVAELCKRDLIIGDSIECIKYQQPITPLEILSFSKHASDGAVEIKAVLLENLQYNGE